MQAVGHKVPRLRVTRSYAPRPPSPLHVFQAARPLAPPPPITHHKVRQLLVALQPLPSVGLAHHHQQRGQVLGVNHLQGRKPSNGRNQWDLRHSRVGAKAGQCSSNA